jgi:glycosyltransferase involved in cell wall biosynthesis
MRTPTPPEIKKLSEISSSLSAPRSIDEVMQYLPHFKAAHAALDRVPDAGGKEELTLYLRNRMPDTGLGRVFFLSFLASVTRDRRYLRDLYECLGNDDFTPDQRYFFYWQLITWHSKTAGAPAPDPTAIYFEILDSYRKLLSVDCSWIDPRDREAGTIVVFTNQLLGIRHAPTADCLDYCYILQNRLKKRVALINTAIMPWSMLLPYYEPVLFNYQKEYCAGPRLEVRGAEFDFYQCRSPMPNLKETDLIVRKVLEIKPAFVLNLGHSNIAADLCAEYLTVATMPFGTNLPTSGGNLFILPRELRPEDDGLMSRLHIAREQVVETRYTFRLPERSSVLTREQLGLPRDAYVIAVVGNRLDEEMSGDFCTELSEFLCSTPQAYLAFMGIFQGYGRLAQEMRAIGRQSVYLGHQKDILAVYECCDAYLNPPRGGGGSSAAFALALGLPVFTRNCGDVANIVGPQFFIQSLNEVKEFIEKSLLGREYRGDWALKAKSRFAEISDREGMLLHIVRQVEERADIRERAHLLTTHSADERG